MSVAVSAGSRLPVFHRQGRVQSVPRRGRSGAAQIVRIEPMSPSTVTDLQALFDRIREADHVAFVARMASRELRCAIVVPIVDRQKGGRGGAQSQHHAGRVWTRTRRAGQVRPGWRAAAGADRCLPHLTPDLPAGWLELGMSVVRTSEYPSIIEQRREGTDGKGANCNRRAKVFLKMLYLPNPPKGSAPRMTAKHLPPDPKTAR